jgi:hypothetical protein
MDSPANRFPIASTIGRVCGESIVGILQIVRVAFLLSPFVLSLPQIARADTVTTVVEYIEYEDANEAPAPRATAIGRYGPFRVIAPETAELDGGIDEASLGDFRRMLAAHPGIATLRIVECPGTENDDANLAIARLIRARGIATHVPAGGSVRSGGVELFLAGARRTADAGAEFGVHSWQDEDGLEARDVAADDPVHAAYIGYYREMGLNPDQARGFYALTNATPFDQVRYLSGDELRHFAILN